MSVDLEEEVRKKAAEEDLNGNSSDETDTTDTTDTTGDTSDEVGSEAAQTEEYHKKKGRKKKPERRLPAADLGYDIIQPAGPPEPDKYPTISDDQIPIPAPGAAVPGPAPTPSPAPEVAGGPQPGPPKPAPPPEPAEAKPEPAPVAPAPTAVETGDPDPDSQYYLDQKVPPPDKKPVANLTAEADARAGMTPEEIKDADAAITWDWTKGSPPQRLIDAQDKRAKAAQEIASGNKLPPAKSTEDKGYDVIEPPKDVKSDATTAHTGPNGEIILPSQTVSAETAKAPPPQVAKPGKNGFYPDENPKKWVVGTATKFGFHDPEDNGMGSPWLGKLDTDNTYLYGVALPEWVLRRRYGDNHAAMQRARVDIVDLRTGKRIRVPIVDVGPSDQQLSKGIAADFTEALDRYFGNDGGSSGHRFAFNLVDDAGPSVKSHFGQFVREQGRLRSGMDVSGRHRVADVGYDVIPKEQADKFAVQAAKEQKDQFAILDDIKDKTPNIAAMDEELQKPHEGVSPTNQNAYLQQFRKVAADNVRDYLKNPKMTDEEALAYARKNPDAGTIVGEIMSKWMPNLQQWATKLGMTAQDLTSQSGAGGYNRLAALALALNDKASKEDQDRFVNHLVNEVPKDQWTGVLTEYAEELNRRAGGAPGANLAGVNIPNLLDALKAQQPEAKAQFQAQRARLTQELLNENRNLRSDPRLAGTGWEQWTQLGGQAPVVLAQILSGPIGEASMASDVFQASKADLAREHPDWDDREITGRAAASTLLQLAPMIGGVRVMGGKMHAMTSRISEIKNPLLRVGAGTAAHAGVSGGLMSTQTLIKNIAEGRSPGEGVLESGVLGAVMGVPGGFLSSLHGKPSAPRIPIRPEEPRAEPPPARAEEPVPPVPPAPKDESRRKPPPTREEVQQDLPVREEEVHENDNANADAEINRDNDTLETRETVTPPARREEPVTPREEPAAPPAAEEPPVPPAAEVKPSAPENPADTKARVLDINRKHLLTPEQERDLKPLIKKVRDLVNKRGGDGSDFRQAVVNLRDAIYQYFRPHYEELGARKLADFESDPGTGMGALINHEGELQLHSNDQALADEIRNYLTHSKDPQRLIAKGLQEEFYHLTHMRNVRDRYEKAGKPGGSAHQYFANEQRRMIEDFVRERDRKRAAGNHADADAMEKVLYDSMRIYGLHRPREQERTVAESEAELQHRLKTGEGLRSLGAELVRQMTQVVHNNELTEKNTRFGRSVLPRVLEYWQGVLDNLMAVWNKMKGRGTPESRLMLAKEIKEVRKTVAEIQRAIRGKPVPAENLTAAISRAMAETDLRARGPPLVPEQAPKGAPRKSKRQIWEEFKTRWSTLAKSGESAMLDQPETRRLAAAVKRKASTRQRIGSDVGEYKFSQAMSAMKKPHQTAEFEAYMKARETGQPLPAVSPEVANAITAWNDISHRMADEMDRLNTHVIGIDGKIRKFMRLGYGKHWARMLSDDFKDMMANRNSHRQADYQAYVQKEVNAGRVKDEAEFLNKYGRLSRADESSNEPFSNMERGRQAQFGSDAYDYSPRAALKYVSRGLNRLAHIEEYGQKLTNNHKDLFDKAIDNLEASTTLSGKQKELIKNRINSIRAAELHQVKLDNISDWTGMLGHAATGTYLGSWLASYANLVGGGAHNLIYAGPKAFLKTIGQMPDFNKLRLEARERNILQYSLMDQMNDLHLTQDQNWMTKGIRGYTRTMLKWGGQHLTEDINRVFAMQSGKNWLQDFAKVYGQGTARERQMTGQLDRLGIRGADVQSLYNEHGNGTLTNEFLRQWVMQTHGNYGPSQTPEHLYNNPLGKALLQFQKWGANASRVLTREYVMPLARSIKDLKAGRSGAAADVALQLGRNLGVLGVMIGSGQLVILGRNLVLGRQENEPTIADIMKRLQQGDNGAALQEAIQKAMSGVVASGLGGAYTNYADLFNSKNWGQTSFRTKDPRTPPVMGLFTPFIDLGISITQEGTVSPKVLDRFFGNLSSAYRYGSQIVKNAAVTADIPTPWNVAKAQKADNDLHFLRMQVNQYEKENPEIQQQIQTEGPRPQMQIVGRNKVSATKDDVHAALITGDAQKVIQAINDYQLSIPEPRRAEAVKKLKSYIESQLPINPGGSKSLENVQGFLQWAKDKLPENEARQIFASTRTIAQTAEETGIFEKSKKLRFLSKLDYNTFGQSGTIYTKARSQASAQRTLHLFNRAVARQQAAEALSRR
jgi:hypothetical protein